LINVLKGFELRGNWRCNCWKSSGKSRRM